MMYKLDKELDSNLINWSKQGILLLNAALTTVYKKSNAHKKIWEEYTNNIISSIVGFAIQQNGGRGTKLIFKIVNFHH